MMSKGFASNNRMALVALGVFTCFVVVGVRLVFLHVIDREVLLQHVERARRQIVIEHARRGTILDVKGNVLATSRSFVQLGADPEMLRKEDEAKWAELAQLLNLPETQIRQTLQH